MGVHPPAGQLLEDQEHLREAFDQLREAARRDPDPDPIRRQRWLRALESLLRDNREELAAAIRIDFGNRSIHETKLLEVFPGLEAVKHARRDLREWMKPKPRSVSLWFKPGRARLLLQPLGVVGIIVPWNYPIYLAVGPLVSALAAGNRAMVKMSEQAPATGELFAHLVRRYFEPDEVRVVLGDAVLAEAFSHLPFDHLLFTGSTAVGHKVMRAAAENLTPVTLELGGKSPAIIDQGFSLDRAAERIVIGKCMNAGQTCIAPDYVLVPAGREREFVETAARVVRECYPDIEHTPDYTAIVNAAHFSRLTGYLDEAREKGAEIISLSAPQIVPDPATRRIPPFAVLGAKDDTRLMQDEIFGPLLPVVPYRDLSEAIAYVNARPRPLALYFFSNDSVATDRVLHETVSGGVTINDTLLHVAQDELPFGGVGSSGMGYYHGREGFDTFSKKKGVFYQSALNGMPLFKPPYGKMFERLAKVLLR